MKTFLMVIACILVATPAYAQTPDNDLPRCRDFPFPFSALCLANHASYRPTKECPEISQHSLKPAGQQCDAGREADTVSISRNRPDPQPHECSPKGHDGGYGKGKGKGKK